MKQGVGGYLSIGIMSTKLDTVPPSVHPLTPEQLHFVITLQERKNHLYSLCTALRRSVFVTQCKFPCLFILYLVPVCCIVVLKPAVEEKPV